MSSHIPQAVIDAAAQAVDQVDPDNQVRTAHLKAALEAAIPHIRAQIVREFLEAAPTDVSTPYRDGIRDGFYQAARIVEMGSRAVTFGNLARFIADLNDSVSLEDNPEYVRGQIELAINILGIDSNDYYEVLLGDVTERVKAQE